MDGAAPMTHIVSEIVVPGMEVECRVCGRPLTDLASRAAGIGPVCAAANHVPRGRRPASPDQLTLEPDMDQPEPYTYADRDGDGLLIAREEAVDIYGQPLPVVLFTAKDSSDGEAATVYVPLDDVDAVMAAIRTAAGLPDPAATIELIKARMSHAVQQAASLSVQLADAKDDTAAAVRRALEDVADHWQVQNEIDDEGHRLDPGWMLTELRRMAAEGRTYTAAAASPDREQGAAQQPETDEEREQREDREEVTRLHAAGDHEHCAVECEVTMPAESMRNFIVANGRPGMAGMLDELLRRARRDTTSVPAVEVSR